MGSNEEGSIAQSKQRGAKSMKYKMSTNVSTRRAEVVAPTRAAVATTPGNVKAVCTQNKSFLLNLRLSWIKSLS